MRKMKLMCHHLFESIQVSWSVSNLTFISRVLCEIAAVIVPIAISWFSKEIINTLSEGTLQADTRYFIFAVVLVLVQLANSSVSKVNRVLAAYHDEKIGHYYRLRIIDKINALEIAYFDNPQFYNEIQNSARDVQAMNRLTCDQL